MSGSPLLVVVDMQRVFHDADSPWATPGFDELAEPITRLVDAHAGRVVFTRFLVPAQPEGSWVPYYARWDEVTAPERRPWFDLAEPYASMHPRTIDRPAFSKWGPEMEQMAGPAKTLVICGVATDCCVIATAIPAADAGMFVRIVADACRGIDVPAHERAIGLAAGFIEQIEITTVDEELSRVSASRAAG